MNDRTALSRRAFAGLTLGAGLGATQHASAAPAEVRSYRRLGRTGLEVSDISLGSSRTTDDAVVRRAFERGVNFFDCAESYRFGSAEKAIGKALAGVRDRVYITSKTRAGASDSEADMMSALEGSLKRLRTDYIDVYFNHAVNSVDRMRNEAWHAFTSRAVEQGKIRFRGVSGHGSRLAEVLDYTLDNDLADVLLVAHNFGQDPKFMDELRHSVHFVALQPDLPPRLERARAMDVGVVGMKTLMGARLNDMKPYQGEGTFAHAALRWTLASGYVDAAVITMSRLEQVDEYLGASGALEVGADDRRMLELYVAMQAGHYCRHGCSDCEGACPSGVEIAEVLRTRMYATDYRDLAFARHDYARIGTNASACLGCSGEPCAGACTHAIPIARYTRSAARALV